MSRANAFVHPEWGPYSIDIHHVRVCILKAVQDALPLFHGTILDVGCGEMPYRDLLLEAPSRATRYIGLDIPGNTYSRCKPDVRWNGAVIPLRDASVESALATQVLEHCPEPLRTLSEIHRVLKPGGVLLITVPFLWPIHDPPYDEYRYTPFSLERLLCEAGFEKRRIRFQAAGLRVRLFRCRIKRRPAGPQPVIPAHCPAIDRRAGAERHRVKRLSPARIVSERTLQAA